MNDPPIDIRPATVADSDRVEALFETVFDRTRPGGSFEWAFFDSPSPGLSVLAEVDGEVVGHAGTISRAIEVDGVEMLLATSIDAMTHPDWRKRGVNRRLSDDLIARNQERGVAVYGGFSNENSTHTVVHNQGRRSLGAIPLLIRPLKLMSRPWRLLFGTPDPLESRAIHWPDDAAALCDELDSAGIGTRRSFAYLQWRYRRPGGAYHLVEYRHGGQLAGLGVLGLRNKGGLGLGFVMEVLSRPGDGDGRDQVVAAICARATELGCDGLCAMAFRDGPARRSYTRRGFLPLSPKLVGEHIEFSVRALDETIATGLFDPARWRLSWGDTDLA